MDELKALKHKLIIKHFPNRKFLDDSIVGNAINKAFLIAWEDAYADGEDAVAQKFDDLMDIIKPLIN